MTQKKLALPFFFLMLALASLACTIFVGGPNLPNPPVPVSLEAAQSIREQAKQAVENAVNGEISLQINESQITSYLAFKLAQDQNPLFTDPQILLRNGEMQIYGKIQRGPFVSNLLITLSITVDPAGKPLIIISDAKFGPVKLPEGFKATLSKIIDEAFTGAVGPAATGFRLESITIAEGTMTLSGKIR
ncbi:MAG: hypothetical protein ACP5QU_10245, partial [Anaerolineae bacterium]